MLAQSVSFLDVTMVLVYLAAVAYLGWLGYRHTKTAADYLLAGRKAHPFIMAMSYGATFISTSAIIGFGGVAGLFGMSVLWLTVLNIFVGIFLAFVVLGGPTRRLGHRIDAHTFPELLGRRFNSKFVQVFAGMVIFCFMPLYAAAVLIGGCEFLATAFGLDYHVALLIFATITAAYVFFGGLKGVLYTDALQGTSMAVGMLFLLVWAYWSIGGVVEGHAGLTAMKDKVGGMAAIGHQGWTAMPKFGWGKPEGLPPAAPSPYDLWWIVVSTIVMGVGIGVLAQPQLIVRFLTVKSGRELNRALAVGGPFILLMTGVAFTVGALSNFYFYKHETITGKLVGPPEAAEVITKRDPGVRQTVSCTLLHIDMDDDATADAHVVETMAGRPLAQVTELPEGRVEVRPNATSFQRALVRQGDEWMFNSDNIIPTFLTTALPRWFRVLFLLTLLSAAMSTMSSQFHALGTAIGRDVFQTLLGGSDRSHERTIHVVRAGIVIGLILAVAIGYYTRGGYFIARATSIFFGMCASAFLPSFVGALFFRRMTKAAVIASMVVGFLTTAFWLLFVKSAEAGAIGLVQKVTDGQTSILANHPNWPVVDPLLVALPLSALTAAIVSVFTRPPSASHLARCFGQGSKATAATVASKA